jgi:hypothetical protein
MSATVPGVTWCVGKSYYLNVVLVRPFFSCDLHQAYGVCLPILVPCLPNAKNLGIHGCLTELASHKPIRPRNASVSSRQCRHPLVHTLTVE